MKPRLLVVELWGLGDLAIATPFLQAASHAFQVTLLAKPFAQELHAHFWPQVRVLPCVAPWTSFHGKYRLPTWPWRELWRLWRALRQEQFDLGLSGRWDPRDHVVLKLSGAKRRLGFARTGSQVLLTQPLARPDAEAHRYENWRVAAAALDLALPALSQLAWPRPKSQIIVVHSGAAQPVRVWPLERLHEIVRRLRALGHSVQVLCDPGQLPWWQAHGEPRAVAPASVSELLALLLRAGLFIGNDSGPGHLAALCGLPTFTLFGPQLPEWFRPLHPDGAWIAGGPCPYKPCFDNCRFASPHCLLAVEVEAAWSKISDFLRCQLSAEV
ncbi:MAG: glycosyltransferase family 9 protein [Pedosphaera parvula]|nr:glycosyltransferase family 9 protein [Verrucomicrobiota bacterium]MBI3192227.1 glycosyltransferase family 9 protein [Pedosphaera parvula]